MLTFEQFWKRYPRKVGKLAAQREWKRLDPDEQICGEIERALAWQTRLWTDPQFIPHPRTWLHQGRWLDEPPTLQRSALETVIDQNADVMADLMGRRRLH